jgi:hypothetical protein
MIWNLVTGCRLLICDGLRQHGKDAGNLALERGKQFAAAVDITALGGFEG